MKYIRTYESIFKNINKYIMENKIYENQEIQDIINKSEAFLSKKFNSFVTIWSSVGSSATINIHLNHITKKEKLEPIINFFKNYDWKIDNLDNKMKFIVTVPHSFLINILD